jgi:hypothetical protein
VGTCFVMMHVYSGWKWQLRPLKPLTLPAKNRVCGSHGELVLVKWLTHVFQRRQRMWQRLNYTQQPNDNVADGRSQDVNGQLHGFCGRVHLSRIEIQDYATSINYLVEICGAAIRMHKVNARWWLVRCWLTELIGLDASGLHCYTWIIHSRRSPIPTETRGRPKFHTHAQYQH